VQPIYPIMAQDRAILAGLATVAIAWDSNGFPADVVVMRATDPTFGDAARDAAEQWRRAPDPAGGREVLMYDLHFVKHGVVISRSDTLGSRLAEQKASDVEPLRVLSARELDAPLRPIAQPMPAFPVAAKGRWDAATVVVEFFVDENGRVRAPIVRESTAPEFAAAALDALRQWQYETPRKDGQPTVMSERWEFQFKKAG